MRDTRTVTWPALEISILFPLQSDHNQMSFVGYFAVARKTKNRPSSGYFLWWGRRDLNPGPLACQASALTNWATPPHCLEARPGIEPGIRVLQTLALPLGHLALFSPIGSPAPQSMLYTGQMSFLERKTGLEPATLALARRCSTAELLPLVWCRRPELNWRHADFQSAALPTELPRHAQQRIPVVVWRRRWDSNPRSRA
jgi:hypothetical protein